MVPLSWLNLFSPKELNELIGGGVAGELDVEDMRYSFPSLRTVDLTDSRFPLRASESGWGNAGMKFGAAMAWCLIVINQDMPSLDADADWMTASARVTAEPALGIVHGWQRACNAGEFGKGPRHRACACECLGTCRGCLFETLADGCRVWGRMPHRPEASPGAACPAPWLRGDRC